jgi:hypothetical protein
MRIPRITDFEHRREQVISRRRFAGRMLKAVGLWLALTVVGLLIGMAGYAEFEEMAMHRRAQLTHHVFRGPENRYAGKTCAAA